MAKLRYWQMGEERPGKDARASSLGHIDRQPLRKRIVAVFAGIGITVLTNGCGHLASYKLPENINDEVGARESECGARTDCSTFSHQVGAFGGGGFTAYHTTCGTTDPSDENKLYCHTGILSDIAVRSNTSPQLRENIVDVLGELALTSSIDVVRSGAADALLKIFEKYGTVESQLIAKTLGIAAKVLQDNDQYVRSRTNSRFIETFKRKDLVARFPYEMLNVLEMMYLNKNGSDYAVWTFVVEGNAPSDPAERATLLLAKSLSENSEAQGRSETGWLRTIVRERQEATIRKIGIDALMAWLMKGTEKGYEGKEVFSFLGEIAVDKKTSDELAVHVADILVKIYHSMGEMEERAAAIKALGKTLERESVATQRGEQIVALLQSVINTQDMKVRNEANDIYENVLGGRSWEKARLITNGTFVGLWERVLSHDVRARSDDTKKKLVLIATDKKSDFQVKSRVVRILEKFPYSMEFLTQIALHSETDTKIREMIALFFGQKIRIGIAYGDRYEEGGHEKQEAALSAFNDLALIAQDKKTTDALRQNIIVLLDFAFKKGSWTSRRTLLERFGQLGVCEWSEIASRKRLFPIVAKAAGDHHEVMRSAAIGAVGAFVRPDDFYLSERALRILKRALHDRDEKVKLSAVNSLKKIIDDSNQSDRVRNKSYEWLDEIGEIKVQEHRSSSPPSRSH